MSRPKTSFLEFLVDSPLKRADLSFERSRHPAGEMDLRSFFLTHVSCPKPGYAILIPVSRRRSNNYRNMISCSGSWRSAS